MRSFLYGMAICLLCPSLIFAWDGFDADSGELVELTQDSVPLTGETIAIKNHDTDKMEEGIVENVKRNRRTLEIAVIYPDGAVHTLVMEAR